MRSRDSIIHKGLLFAFFVCVVYPATANFLSVGQHRTGLVRLPENAIQKDDLVIAVFSDSLIPDPMRFSYSDTVPSFSPQSGDPLEGCLSVVHLDLVSGTKQFQQEALVEFGCNNVPLGSDVYGWINNTWVQIPSERTPHNGLKASVKNLTTYAIFPTFPSNAQRRGQI